MQPIPTFVPGVAYNTSSDDSTLCRGSGGTFSSDDGDIVANPSFLNFETEISGNTSSSAVQLVKSVKLGSNPPSWDDREPSRGVEVRQESVLLVFRAPKFRYWVSQMSFHIYFIASDMRIYKDFWITLLLSTYRIFGCFTLSPKKICAGCRRYL